MQISGLNALYQAAAARRTANTAQAPASQSGTDKASDAGEGVSSYDFTNMTRNEMKDFTQKLYKSGQMSFDELSILQLAGPLGKVGANGEFVPFTDAERAQIDKQPMDYMRMANDAISGIESRGAASDPKSGYQTWQSVRSLLQSWQGQASAVNLTA